MARYRKPSDRGHAGVVGDPEPIRRVRLEAPLDRSGASRKKPITLTATEFIRRMLLLVLPPGFHRIRHYARIMPTISRSSAAVGIAPAISRSSAAVGHCACDLAELGCGRHCACDLAELGAW